MALEKDFFVLSEGTLESLQQTEDDFVWVHQKDLAMDSDTLISPVRQEQQFERATEFRDVTKNKNQHSIISSNIISDFIENDDFSHYEYWDQFEPIVERITHDRKSIKKEHGRKRVTSSKTMNSSEENELIHPALKTFDGATTEILKSIVTSNNYYRGLFGNYVSKGTNSVVIYAWISKKTYPLWHPGIKPDFYKFRRIWKMWRSEENAVKVYKLGENTVDERIFQQVQKEKQHLLLLHRVKCNVPEVRHSSRNVIVMSFVGEDGEPAPSINTLPQLSREIYHVIIKDIEMWYKTLHLVHGKLSIRNILYWKDQPHYVGWSHSVKINHPLALKKLMRDCLFITKFFEARLATVKSTERLFKDITGLHDIDNSVLSMIHSMDLWKSQYLANPNRTPSRHKYSPASCRFK